jgi:hypothetical protein
MVNPFYTRHTKIRGIIMKDLRLIDIVKYLSVGTTIITREELVDQWNRENPDNPAEYKIKLPAELAATNEN